MTVQTALLLKFVRVDCLRGTRIQVFACLAGMEFEFETKKTTQDA